MLRLVDRIYQGAVDPHAWPGIIRELTDSIRSPKGLLLTNFVSPEHGGLNISIGISQSSLEKWNAHYIPHDVWTQAALSKGLFKEGAVVLDGDLIPEHEFVRSKIYRELLEQEGVGRICAGLIFASQERGVHPTTFGTYRGISDPSFGEVERETMRLFVPHLSRALGVMYRLHDAELKLVATLDALDRLAAGVLLLDTKGAVQHVNREAKRLLDTDDGLALGRSVSVGGGYDLVAHNTAAHAALVRALASVVEQDVLHVSHFSTTVEVPRPSGRRPFILQFAPLPESNEFTREPGSASAIVFITEQDRAVPLDPVTLRRLFQLTEAEVRLAERLCSGDTLKSAAARLRIAESTAKSELASVFQKTGTHRQAELVRLLVSLGSSRT